MSHDHLLVSCSRTQKVLTSSDRGCWSLCGQYHGRIQQRPWRRHRGQSSTSSAYQSVEEKKDKFIRGEQHLAEEKRVLGARSGPYKEQRKHGLSHIEAMSPVVVGDVAVSLADRIHPSCQGLHGGRGRGRNAIGSRTTEKWLKTRGCLIYLCLNFEFFYHPQFEEAADATFDELKL